jgi:hypothetical protein
VWGHPALFCVFGDIPQSDTETNVHFGKSKLTSSIATFCPALRKFWMALSLSNLLRAFNAFREDYRRIHKVDSN